MRLVGRVGENSFTDKRSPTRVRLASARTNSNGFPTRRRTAVPKGYLLDYKGKETKRRRDDKTVVQHRYHCPAEHCRGCPLRERCVKNPEKGRTVKRLEGEEIIESHKEYMKTDEAKAALPMLRIEHRMLFWRREKAPRSRMLGWLWFEEGQSRGRPGDLGPKSTPWPDSERMP